MKRDTIITLALLAGGALAVYWLYRKAGGIASATLAPLTSAGESIGSTLFDWFGPSVTGDDLYYSVTFPDGARHAIGSSMVDSQGRFSYQSKNYRISLTPDGFKVAVPI